VTNPYDPNQQDQGYQSGLPSFPNAPSANFEPGQAPVPAPPTEIQASFWCYIGAAVIVLIGGLLYIGAKQTVIDALRNADTSNTFTETQLESLANTTIAIVVVFAAIIAALYALFAFKLRAGRNWARIVLTIIAALDLIGLISGRGGAAVGYVGALAAIVGCVLSYLPNASAYFAAVKAARYRG
jgi:hypothetical protein